MTNEADQTAKPPMLQIVNADATPEEIAAIVAVFASLGGTAPTPTRARPAWSSPERAVRRSLPTGRGAWRSSALPR